MNRRDFISAAITTGIMLAVPVFHADGVTVVELLIVLVIVTVAAIIVVKLYKLAKDKLYPPPPPPPPNNPPPNKQAATTTLDTGDSGLIYPVSDLNYTMRDGSLCNYYAVTLIESAPTPTGPWDRSDVVQVWLSGTQMLVQWRDAVITGTLAPKLASATLTDTSEPSRFYRTKKP